MPRLTEKAILVYRAPFSTSKNTSRNVVKAIKGSPAPENIPNIKGAAGAINLYKLYRKDYWNTVSTIDGDGDGIPDPSFTVPIANSWKNRKNY